MKRIIFTIGILLSTFLISFSQAPQAFKYQTVVRDSLGGLIVNTKIMVRMSVLQGSSSGTAVYSELHNPTTNQYGFISLYIGSGVMPQGNFSDINWGGNSFYIKTEIDLSGGFDFKTIGTSQLLSVPYALYANKSGTGGSGGVTGPTGPPGLTGPTGATGSAGNIEKMTDAQRDTIKNPAAGLIIYNITTNCLNIYNGTNWFQDCKDSSNCVPQPTKSNAGPDQYLPGLTTTTLSANTPIKGTGAWSIISGAGGNIQTPSSPTSVFTGTALTTYVLRWTITTACTSSYSDVTIHFLKICDGVTDYGGNVYTAVTIGTQCWMQQNLKTNLLNNGYVLTLVSDNPTWYSEAGGYYCWYNNDVANKDVYGALYNWNTVKTGKLCPTGWRMPSKGAWDTLVAYLGGSAVAGVPLKEAGTSHWSYPNTGATNSSGFTGVPGGYRQVNGTFALQLYNGFYVTSGTSGGYVYELYYNNTKGEQTSGVFSTAAGFSVRCIKN